MLMSFLILVLHYAVIVKKYLSTSCKLKTGIDRRQTLTITSKSSENLQGTNKLFILLLSNGKPKIFLETQLLYN